MNASSTPRFIEPVRPVDPGTRRILLLVDRAAAASGASYFVAGAVARDLMLVHAFGMTPGRATRDIDFGIAVEDWDQFERLKHSLIESGEFEAAPANTHRLVWNAAHDGVGIPVDLIPFDGVASKDKTIAWPPRGDGLMNVAGFEEALESAVRMRIANGLVARVASIPGLAVMKVVSWQDRRHENNKDATDLHRLLATYADAGNLNRIYSEELDLLEGVGFDVELAGSELLGRDAARICQPETHRQISLILMSQPLVDQLVRQMRQTGWDGEPDMERTAQLVERFSAAFLA
jgi:predicted nucleotidyltransferase